MRKVWAALTHGIHSFWKVSVHLTSWMRFPSQSKTDQRQAFTQVRDVEKGR